MNRHDAAPASWVRQGRFRLALPPVDPWIVAGLVAFLGLLAAALFGATLAPHEPIYFVLEHGKDPRPYDPGVVFPFGSDVLGRDLFSLVLAGARATLTVVLLAGLARVLAGVAMAAFGTWWRPVALATESIADFASAVPATLVALVLVKVFVRSADTSIAVFIGALLVTGWAGPYRVVRAELDRLAHAPFAEGAAAIGVGRWRVFWRHQLPHLVPTLAMNLSQQVVASLVLLAELGVLGVFVGATRQIGVEESLGSVINGIVNFAQIADPPEWGGLLASARTIESLWTTRWLIFVPGVAFALTAIAVAMVGLAISRRYARRDVIGDLRSRGAAVLVVAVAAFFAVGAVVPPRHAAAISWANDSRAAVHAPTDAAGTFADAGLHPLGESFALTRSAVRVAQTAAATISVGGISVSETWPRVAQVPFAEGVRSFVTTGTGGGVVAASLVFAARGITPSDYPPPVTTSLYAGKIPDLGDTIKEYPDDYAGIDVRGKVVLLIRFMGVVSKLESANVRVAANGIGVEESIATAIRHGAAAVVFVDPALPYYTDRVLPYTFGSGRLVGGVSPYFRAEQDAPAASTNGVPVVVLSDKAAAPLASAYGIDLPALVGQDQADAWKHRPSVARDLGVTARVEVPLERKAATATTVLGEVADVPHAVGHVMVWAVRQPGDPHPSADALAAVARALAPRGSPFIFVDFDPSVDPKQSAQSVRDALGDRRVSLVVVMRNLNGDALRFTTPFGDLIPALDLYASQARARALVTQTTAPITSLDGIAPFIDLKTVLIEGTGDSGGDLRGDAAAVVGYLAGRLALGAEELPR